MNDIITLIAAMLVVAGITVIGIVLVGISDNWSRSKKQRKGTAR